MQKINHVNWDMNILAASYRSATQLYPHYLQQWQNKEAQLFEKLGLPHRHLEDWKYTDLSFLAQHEFEFLLAAQGKFDLDNFTVPNAYRLVFINGHFQSHLSQDSSLPQGMRIIPFSSLSEQDSAILDAISQVQQHNPLSHLNAALLTDGIYLEISKNTVLEKPIHLLFINQNDKPSMHHPRNIIRVAENCQVTVLEEYYADSEVKYLNNVVTTLFCGANSRIDYFKLQNESSQAFHLANTSIFQKRDSVVKAHHFALGGQLAREDINFQLQESGAQAELNGFYYVKSKSHKDFHTRIYHCAPQTVSDQNYYGLLTDQGVGVFNGKIAIDQNAPRSSAKQFNRNLLLSKTAEINTKPELEINIDDVRCTHGATVGSLDPSQLFYLQSRGIPKEQAIHILKQAFLEELRIKIGENSITRYLYKKLEVIERE